MTEKRLLNGGVACPQCKQRQSEVIDSRGTKSGKVRRRRECPCGHRFTTYERIGMDEGATIRRRLTEITTLLRQLRSEIEHNA
jgi:transcriptional repressor NrdR